MRRGLMLSVAFHVGLVGSLLLAWAATPAKLEEEVPVTVELVSLPDAKNGPAAPAPAEAAPLPKREAATPNPLPQPEPQPAPPKVAEPLPPPPPPPPPSLPPKPAAADPPPEPDPPRTIAAEPKPEVPRPVPAQVPVAKPEPPKPQLPKPEPVKPAVPEKPKVAEKVAEKPPEKLAAKLPEKPREPPKPEPPKVAERKPDPKPPERIPPKPAAPIVSKPAEKAPEKPAEDSFAALLKSVERLDKLVQADKASPGAGRALPQPQSGQGSRGEAQLTAGEMDGLRREIERCWNVPVGVRGLEDMQVLLRINLNRDGSVVAVTVQDQARMASDPAFRTVAESARRAVQSCRLTPPAPEKYAQWRDIIMTFHPGDALRG